MGAQVSIRFLVGLNSPTDPSGLEPFARGVRQDKRRADALRYLGSVYAVGGAYSGRGYWQGESEPCLQFETIQTESPEARASARAHAANLRGMLGQEAIGLVFAPVELELI